jgi:outer membrane protein assembly factor BamB
MDTLGVKMTRRLYRTALLVLCTLILSLPTQVHAENSDDVLDTSSDPQFRMGTNNLGAVIGDLPSDNTTLWSASVDAIVLSSPVVWDGRVFIGTMDGRFLCLSATSGKVLWEHEVGDAVESTPACDGAWVYFGADDGQVYCLNVLTGAERWNYSTGAAIKSSPTLYEDLLYIGSNDHNVYCLHMETGAFRWNLTTGSYVYSTPAIYRDLVFFGSCDGKIYAVDRLNGTIAWTFQAEFTPASPAVTRGSVYIGTYDKHFYCLNWSTGEERWNFTTEGQIYASASVDPGREPFLVCVCDDVGNLYLREGETLTKVPLGLGGITASSLLIEDPSLGNLSVVVATKEGFLASYDILLEEGKVTHTVTMAWAIRLGTSISSSPFPYNGRIYVGAEVDGGGLIACVGKLGSEVRITFEEPLEGGYLLTPVTFRLHVEGGPVDTVDMIIDGVLFSQVDYLNGSWVMVLQDSHSAFIGRVLVVAQAWYKGSFMGASTIDVHIRDSPPPAPLVTIDNPLIGEHVGDVVVAYGSVRPDARWPALRVDASWDDTNEWTNASGIANWTVALSTSSLEDGVHALTVRAFNGYSWRETKTWVRVGEPESTEPTWMDATAMVLLLVVVVALMLTRPRRPPKPSVPTSEPTGKE